MPRWRDPAQHPLTDIRNPDIIGGTAACGLQGGVVTDSVLAHRRGRRYRGPVLDVDLFSRTSLIDPQRIYSSIRDAGPVVWLPRHRMWAMGRYADVRATLKDDELYHSGGISFNRLQNPIARKTTLGSDGHVHARRRKLLVHTLGAKSLTAVEPRIAHAAQVVIEDLLGRPSFDGVADFASRLPLSVVAELVGVPVDSRKLLKWGRVAFDANGPVTNRRALRTAPGAIGLWLYATRLNRSRVADNSWADSVLTAGERGDVGRSEAKSMVLDFITPSLDTTILAAAQMLWNLGEQPEAWHRLRSSPDLIPAAVMEAARLASPIRGFVRTASRDHTIDGVHISAGERIAMLFASANMDETQFPEPERFDLNRRGGNLAWGYGAHACVGMHLSKMEMAALLQAMVPRVEQIQVSRPYPLINNGLQGLSAFTATFVPTGR